MTPNVTRADSDLMCAVGLAWGLVSSQRADDAATLVRACVLLWPDADETRAMQAVCACLIGDPGTEPAAGEALPSRWASLVKMVRARCRLWLGRSGDVPPP